MKCVVCESERAEPFYEGILKCGECGHVYADTRLDEETLRALYTEDYFKGEEYSDYVKDRRTIQKNFRKRLDVLERFLDPSRHRNLLEIGSAYGFFLDTARDSFSDVEGIDVVEEGCQFARDELDLSVKTGDILSSCLGRDHYDVICFWDTIEHLQDPHLYVEKASELTSTGALLAMTTGDIASLNSRMKRENWRLIHPPTHLHYFTKQSLERLLDRYGFDVVYNRYCGFYRSLENTLYNILVLRKGLKSLYRVVHSTGLGRVDFYLNLYDITYVIARRR